MDTTLFNPSHRVEDLMGQRQPGESFLVYVGRVSKEKSIEDFCRLADLPGFRCTVVGDGPQRKDLEKRYGDRIRFVGFKQGVELAQYYASADVMVFPSRTDTFGNVITESMASGTPVAAYPVMGAQGRNSGGHLRRAGRGPAGGGKPGPGLRPPAGEAVRGRVFLVGLYENIQGNPDIPTTPTPGAD